MASFYDELLAAIGGGGASGPQKFREGIPAGVVTASELPPMAMAGPLPASMSYPTAPQGIDLSAMAGVPAFEASPFPAPPPMAPAPPAPMAAQPGVAGLDSPIGGGGAPFSMGGDVPPSMKLATTMAAPLQPQAPVPAQNAPFSGGSGTMNAPAPAAPPVMAMGGDQPVDVGAARRAAPLAPAAPAPEEGGGSLMDRLRSFAPALAGAGAALQGDQGHLATALAAKRDALALQTQTQNVTAKALLMKGAPPEDVSAALKSPELLKALIGQYYAKDKGVKLEKFKGADGRETAAWVDPDNKTIVPAKVPGQADGDGPPALNEAQNRRVQAIIEGREPYPSPNTRSGDAQLIREAVHAADPAFDAVNYNSRVATRKNFTSGKAAGNVTAFNTAINHLGSLDSAIDGLNNSGFPAWNKYIANPVAEQFDSKYQTGLKKFQAARTAVADELTRAFRGSGGNVHDIIQWENAINSADSPAALKAAVRQAAELLNGRITSLGDEYNRGMGSTKDPLELLNPKAAASFKQMLEGEREGKPAAPLKGSVSIGGQTIPWSVQ